MAARNILLTFLLFLFTVSLSAYEPKPSEFIEKQNWEKHAKGYDFTENLKEIKEKPKVSRANTKFNWFPSVNALWIKYALYTLVILTLLGFLLMLLIKLYRGMNEKVGNSVSSVKSLNVDDIRQIDDATLLRILHESLKAGLFKDAVRVHYLILIRKLSGMQLVTWKKDKTNGAYINEMYGKNGFELFRTLTIGFDRIWYGNIEIREHEYHSFVPLFDEMHKIIDTVNPS